MEVNIDSERNRLYTTFPFPVHCRAGVKTHTPYPSLYAAFSTKLLESFPEVDQYLLEHIVNFFGPVREEVADSIYGLFIFSDYFVELYFYLAHLSSLF